MVRQVKPPQAVIARGEPVPQEMDLWATDGDEKIPFGIRVGDRRRFYLDDGWFEASVLRLGKRLGFINLYECLDKNFVLFEP